MRLGECFGKLRTISKRGKSLLQRKRLKRRSQSETRTHGFPRAVSNPDPVVDCLWVTVNPHHILSSIPIRNPTHKKNPKSLHKSHSQCPKKLSLTACPCPQRDPTRIRTPTTKISMISLQPPCPSSNRWPKQRKRNINVRLLFIWTSRILRMRLGREIGG